MYEQVSDFAQRPSLAASRADLLGTTPVGAVDRPKHAGPAHPDCLCCTLVCPPLSRDDLRARRSLSVECLREQHSTAAMYLNHPLLAVGFASSAAGAVFRRGKVKSHCASRL